MSLHSSLHVDLAGSQQRTVLSRIERIKDMMKKNLWTEGRAVTGLPKTKILKIKSRKAAKVKDETADAAGAAAPGAEGAAKPDAKAAAGGKAAPAAKPGAEAKPKK